VDYLPDNKSVARTAQGLKRMLIRFPDVFAMGTKIFQQQQQRGDGDSGDRSSMSLGFSLYDWRVGPTEEESRVVENIDAQGVHAHMHPGPNLSMYLRLTMLRCPEIRALLKIGRDKMSPEEEKVAADMIELHVAKPPVEPTSAANRQRNNNGQMTPMAARYCYVKLVAPDKSVNENYHTYFWSKTGQRMSFETVIEPPCCYVEEQEGVMGSATFTSNP
jgi:hypothetical protein